MDPSELLHDHGQRPRNMGRMLDAHATGNFGSIVAGRALRLFVTVNGDRVAACKFQVFACQEQVGPTSVLSELVIDKSISDCLQLGHTDIAEALGGLAIDKLPAVLWGPLALRDALQRFQGSEGLLAELDTTGPAEPLLCRCHGVDETTVKELIRAGNNEPDHLVTATSAGTGCGTCKRDIARFIEEVSATPQPVAAAAPKASLGRIGLMQRVNEAVTAIRTSFDLPAPALEPWDMQETTVICRARGVTDERTLEQIQDRLERYLKDEIDPLLRAELIVVD